jgi:ABC-type nitrate/sulfonate/bicarbonate transport system permease component
VVDEGSQAHELSMKPLVPVSPGARIALGAAFFVVFFAVWAVATFGGFVQKTFLADPLAMFESGWVLLTKMGFAKDIGMTVWRVVGGFLIAAALALPLGVSSASRATCRRAPSSRCSSSGPVSARRRSWR